MQDKNAAARAAGGRHLILIVDDELINRELLRMILEQEYDTLTAPDGESALEAVRQNSKRLSLILLDLLMPGMHGLEVLRNLQEDPELRHIPVIVLTADQQAEVESLRAGAVDFLSKPYPEREVILARVSRTIEMTENRELIESTERDGLTGLLNREYFYRYADQFDQHRPDREMDAIVVDISHFHMVNERYGKAFGDQILCSLGEGLRSMVMDEGGIVCRRDADIFLIYCPHREDYQAILDGAIRAMPTRNNGSRIRLRMGVYANADREIELERRFDRAKMAADTLIGSYRSSWALFDQRLHEKEDFAEHLLESFDAAIQEKQFQVYFQPKFDIRPDKPVLASAEALVRWIHPELGFINPGQFIPLFEENGLIPRLDEYVWRETAARIRDWKTRLGISVPVSVNVSRVDMFDADLVITMRDLLRENGLTPEDLHLEITESAYTGDSSQIIEKVHQLRDLGFHIEMDDFGTGYSSLNMISELPIDALKLDMIFIRTAFAEGGDRRLIEIIIDIADFLNVPVIAEGVETEGQMKALRDMGCDLVQGYYFSRPVPAEQFEEFLKEKQRRILEEGEEAVYRRSESRKKALEPQAGNRKKSASRRRSGDRRTFQTIALALTGDFDSIYYVDTLTDNYQEFSTRDFYEDLKIDLNGTDFFGESRRNIPRVVYEADQERLAAFLSKEAILRQLETRQSVSMEYRLMIGNKPVWFRLKVLPADDRRYLVAAVSNISAEHAGAEPAEASREDGAFLSSAVPARSPREYDAASAQSSAYSRIARALSREYFSIYVVNTETDEFTEYTSSQDDGQLQVEQKGADFFRICRQKVLQQVCREDLERALAVWDKSRLLPELADGRTFSTTYRLIMDNKPVYINFKIIRMADELSSRYIVIGVSNVDEQMKREQELLAIREKANRDPLTGTKSKHAYVDAVAEINTRMDQGSVRPFAVVVCDVNGLKNTNDTQGHQAGDSLIISAARIICAVFKHSPVYRVGGDEFVAVLNGMDFGQRDELVEEMHRRNSTESESGGTVIACGMSEWRPDTDDRFEAVFDRADAAMYEDKRRLKEKTRG